MMLPLTESIFLDAPRLSALSSDLPIYRSALFGKDGLPGMAPEGQPGLGFPPPPSDLPYEPDPFLQFLTPAPFDLLGGEQTDGASGGPGSLRQPPQLGHWEQRSGADFLGSLSMESGTVQSAQPMQALATLAAAAARGLSGLFAAGRVSEVGAPWLPGEAGEGLSLSVADVGKFPSMGEIPSAARTGADGFFLPEAAPSLLEDSASAALDTAGPFSSLWQRAADVVRSTGARISNLAFSARMVRGAAQKFFAGIIRGSQAGEEVLLAPNGSSAFADPLGGFRESGASLRPGSLGSETFKEAPAAEGEGEPPAGAESLRVDPVTNGEGREAKTVGEQILEVLRGMPGSASLAGASGTTLLFPRGLWMMANRRNEQWDTFSGSSFGSEEGGVGDPDTGAGLSIAGGEPMRALVGAARLLAGEENRSEGGELGGDPAEVSPPVIFIMS